MRSRDDDEDNKRWIPKRVLLKILVSLLIAPVSAFLLGIDALGVIVGGLTGCVVLFVLVQRPGHGRIFSYRAVGLSIAAQVSSMLLFNTLLNAGSLSIIGRYPKSKLQIMTEFADEVKTMSVVLPCANEGILAVKTARGIGERTPKEVLHEIVIVDDGSTPPLEEFFNEQGKDVLDTYPVKFIRHETFTGLINAKKQGGDRATGDVLVFLDCHVLPRNYGFGRTWADGIMSRIAGNYKRVVVPSITDLDSDTWEEIGQPPGIAKCYLSLDVDFRWFESDDDFVPIMSGGLLAMSRRWWVETGGYDSTMIGWGGENIDQSLRIWLCGGEIVQATDSHVAHMWRVNHKPETKAKYTVPEGSVITNRYKAALAWFDDYIEKVNEFSPFSKFVGPTAAPPPNIDSILEIKRNLKCKPFQWFIDRFPDVYFGANVLPDEVFRVRDQVSNLCLARRKTEKRDEHEVVAVPCSTEDTLQLWHRGNRDGDKCCSGIRSMDSMYCLAGNRDGAVHAHECNTYGHNDAQFVKVTPEGEISFTRSKSCLSIGPSTQALVVQAPCDMGGFLRRFRREQVNHNNGFGRGLYRIVEESSGKCLTAFSPLKSDNDAGNIELSDCRPRSGYQMFNITDVSFAPGFSEIRTWENLCLDAADDKRLLAYQCYDESMANLKQVFSFSAENYIQNKFHPTCLSVPDPKLPSDASKTAVKMSGCNVWDGVTKLEQMYTRVPSGSQPGMHLIKSGDWCMSGDGDSIIMVKCPKSASEETKSMIWQFQALNRVRNVHANKCIDGNNAQTPILYPCYPTENDNQEWSDPLMEPHLLKNSRAKVCLDYNAVPERKATVSSNCETEAHWTMYDPHEPSEHRIYRQTQAKETAAVHG